MALYPLPPWRLQGTAFLRLQLLPIKRVRHAVPANLTVQPAVPGRTLGGLFIAHYRAGSTLEYHELIVMPAIVKRGFRVGAWVSHIYVDDPQSVAAGREVWGLPKQLAQFRWEHTARGTAVEVTAESLPLCSLSMDKPRRFMPTPIYVPVLSQRGEELLAFSCSGTSRLGMGAGVIHIPASSPFSSFGITSGRQFHVDNFDLRLPTPVMLSD